MNGKNYHFVRRFNDSSSRRKLSMSPIRSSIDDEVDRMNDEFIEEMSQAWKQHANSLEFAICSTPTTTAKYSIGVGTGDEDDSPSNGDQTAEAFEMFYQNTLMEVDKLRECANERNRSLREFVFSFCEQQNKSCIGSDENLSDTSIKGLLERWEVMEEGTENMEKLCKLQRDITDLRDQLRDVACKIPSMATNLQDKVQLESNICMLKGQLSNLKEKKSLVTKYNTLAHRLSHNSKLPLPSLKEDITELYRIWEETYQTVSQQLSSLEETISTWQHFELHLAELQTALQGDQHALSMLNYVIEGGTFTADIANSVRDVAKNLSEKQESLKINNGTGPIISMDAIINAYNNSGGSANGGVHIAPFSIEGSLSDSGISDSGSEQDLCEREKRLATLKKLARHLESVLAPGSVALLNIIKRIDETEDELRELKQTCKSLIAKTSASDMFCQIGKNDGPLPLTKKNDQGKQQSGNGEKLENKVKKGSLFWRVIKAALPFHMAVAVLICVVCLLEPHCCDTLNTFGFSFLPQLRYTSGPPPT